MEMKHLKELGQLQTYHEDIVSEYQFRTSVDEKNESLRSYRLTVDDKKDIYDEYDVLRYLNACEKMVNDDRFDRTTRPLKKPKTDVAIRTFERHLALMDEEETYMRENRSDYKKHEYDRIREAVHYYIERFLDEKWVKALPKKILKPEEIRALRDKKERESEKDE